MASLMSLQSRSAQEREEEKRLDILLKPALPGATTTVFGGLKRQKILNTALQIKDLGIKRKHLEDNRKSTENQIAESENNSLSLVCSYSSSTSSDDTE